jgi:hypothetical protein
VFHSNFVRGFYGRGVSRTSLEKQQYEWFLKIKNLIEDKNYSELIFILTESQNNKVSKEFFTRLTGIDLNRKSEKNIHEILMELCGQEKVDEKKKYLIQDWKRFINMDFSEVTSGIKEEKFTHYYRTLSNVMSKTPVDLLDEDLKWIEKHIQLLKKLKDTKSSLRDETGNPTRKLVMLKKLGFDPEK